MSDYKRGNLSYACIFFIFIFIYLLLFFSNIQFVYATPGVTYSSPTPSNNYVTPNSSIVVNISVNTASNLSKFLWSWNNSNYTLYDGNLVLMMNFNNLSNLVSNSSPIFVNDASKYGNNGTCYNMGVLCNLTTGKYDRGIYFDAALSGGILIPNSPTLNPRFQGTIETWIKLTGTAAWRGLVVKQTSYYLNVHADNKVWARFYSNAGSGSHDTNTTLAITDTNWHHVVLTWDTTNSTNMTQIYVDGNLVGSAANLNAAYGADASTNPLYIGAYYTTAARYFNGTIDEVKIYNRTMYQNEVLQEYYSNLNKYDADKYAFITNQSSLINGTYPYYVWVNDTDGTMNTSGTQSITIGSVTVSNNAPNASIVYPLGGSTFNLQDWMNFSLLGIDAENLSINGTLFINNAINGTNSTLLNNTLWIYNTSLGYGTWTAIFRVCDQDSTVLCTNSTPITFTLSNNPSYTAPSVVFSSQIPNDINSLSLVGHNAEINYSISDSSYPLNLSTINFYFKINSTTRDSIIFINGTATQGYSNEVYTSNISDLFHWLLDDNDIYPAVYNLNEEPMENVLHTQQQLTNTNDYAIEEFYNVTNTTQYNFLEIMANSSAIMRVYYCNSSYNFASNPTGINACTLFNTFPANSPYNHTESAYSLHQVAIFALNTTSGTIGTVKVTPTSYFLLRGNSGGPNVVNFYTISNTSRVGAYRTTTNSGGTWTNQTYTIDSHFHQFSGSSSIYYYVCANNTMNSQNCSSIRQDLFELAGLPPSQVIFYNPIESGSYSGNIIINYTASLSPNNYAISFYNISLVNLDLSFNKTITSNNSINLTYSWNSIGTKDGSYLARIITTDSLGQSSTSYSDSFIIDNNFPNITISSPENNTNLTYTNVTFNCTSYDDANLSNVSLYFSSGSGVSSGVISLVQNITNNIASAANTITCTLSSPATAGDLLVTVIGSDKKALVYTVPSGFTMIQETSAASVSGAIAYKIAVGGETALQWSQSNTSGAGGLSCWAAEYSGTATSNVLDVSAENETYSSPDTVTATINTGTTSTTSQANELAIAMMIPDTMTNVDGTRTWSNGFTETSFVSVATSGGVGFSIANKTLTSTGQQVSTFSATDTGDQLYAAIATFKGSAGGIAWHLNQTQNISGIKNETLFIVNLTDNATYTWNCLVTDSANNKNFSDSNYTFAINTSAAPVGPDNSVPSVALSSPSDISIYANSSVIFNCSATDNIQLKNISLFGNFSGTFTFNQSTNVNGTSNFSSFTVNNLNGTYLWNCLACDNSSNCAFSNTNFTVNAIPGYVSPSAQPVWGVLHSIHTTISDGSQSESQRVTSLKSYYDWASTVDHAAAIDATEWTLLKNETNGNNSDNNFTYMLGYEWKGSAANSAESVGFFADNGPSALVTGGEASYDSWAEWAAWLQQNNGIATINHPARNGNVVNWADAGVKNETYLPVVEIINKGYFHWNDYWNCTVGSGCTTFANPSPDSSTWTGGVRMALANGLHIGFVAGYDYHGAPATPNAYTGLYNATNWSRAGVIDTIRKRHTWAAQDKIFMDIRVSNGSNVYFMGDAFSYAAQSSLIPINFSINATTGKTLANVSLFVNGLIVNVSRYSGLQNVTGSINANLTNGSESYIFIEGLESDGSRAFASPMFINFTQLYSSQTVYQNLSWWIHPHVGFVNSTSEIIVFRSNESSNYTVLVNGAAYSNSTFSNDYRELTITGLSPNTMYVYSVNITNSTGDNANWNGQFLSASDTRSDFYFLGIGDSQGSATDQGADAKTNNPYFTNRSTLLNASFVIALGDTMGGGVSDADNVIKVWDNVWYNLSSNFSVFQSLGNHEMQQDITNRVDRYRKYYINPHQGNSWSTQSYGSDEFVYSIDYGSMIFIFVDNWGSSSSLDNNQINFINQTLHNSTKKWKVLGGHEAWFDNAGYKGVIAQSSTLLNIFNETGVDLVIGADIHYWCTNLTEQIPEFNIGVDGSSRRGNSGWCQGTWVDNVAGFNVFHVTNDNITIDVYNETEKPMLMGVTIYDKTDYSHLPVMQNASIRNSTGGITVVSTDKLVGWAAASSSADTLINYSYKWFKNNVLNSTGTFNSSQNNTEVNIGNYTDSLLAAENWTLEVTPITSIGNGAAINSSQITISTAPVVSGNLKWLIFPHPGTINTTSEMIIFQANESTNYTIIVNGVAYTSSTLINNYREVNISNLNEDTIYNYSVVATNSIGAAARWTGQFLTSSNTRSDFYFAMIGDSLGSGAYQGSYTSGASTATIATLATNKSNYYNASFVCSIGDMTGGSAASSNASFIDFSGVWSNLTSNYTWYDTVGNHEFVDSEGIRTRRAFFPNPHSGNSWSTESYGSDEIVFRVDYGSMTIVYIDDKDGTNTIDANQVDFINQTFMNSTKKWKVVFGHYPFFDNNRYGGPIAQSATLLDIFNRTGVDLVVGSDIHYWCWNTTQQVPEFNTGVTGASLRQDPGWCVGYVSDNYYGYNWFHVTNNNITVQIFNLSDSMTVNVTFFDKTDYFHIPVMQNASIRNSTGGITILNTDKLVGWAAASSSADTQINYSYKWFRNNVFNSTGTFNSSQNNTEVNIGNYTDSILATENWTLEVTPITSIGNGAAINSSVVITTIAASDTTAPIYVSGSIQKNLSIIYFNTKVNFTTNWSDETKLDSWIFETDNSGSYVNSTPVGFGTAASGSNISSYVTTITAVPGTIVHWRFWANDSSNNWNVTSTQSFTVSDNQAPIYTTGSIRKNQTNIYANTRINFSANWSDNTTLDIWKFEINKTGLWVNSTLVSFGANNNISSIIYLVDSNANVNISYRFWANDSSGNLGVTSYDSFIVGDNQVPTYILGSVVKNQSILYPNTKINFTANWTDDTKLDSWIFSLNQTGVYVNSTSRAFGTGLNMSTNISMINAAVGTNVTWRFWANDSSNNWNVTSVQNFIINDNVAPNYTQIWTNTILYYSNSLINFSSNWTDSVALDSFILEINETGLWENSSSVVFPGRGISNTASRIYQLGLVCRGNLIDTCTGADESTCYSQPDICTALVDYGPPQHFTDCSPNYGYCNDVENSYICGEQSGCSWSILPYGNNISWRFWANDSSNNWNVTSVQSFFVSDNQAPTYIAGSVIKNQSTVYFNTKINFTANWSDETRLDSWIFETDNSGSYVNSTSISFATGKNISSQVITIIANPGTIVHWRFWANDSSNNLNVTSTQSFTVSDNQAPVYAAGSLIKNQTIVYTNTRINFSANWSDNTTLNSWIFEINKTGLWVNSTPVAFTTSNNISSIIYIIDSNANVNISYRFWANDSSGNLGVTSYDSFIVSVTPDTTNPVVSLLTPSDNYVSTSSTMYFVGSFSDNIGLANSTLMIWNSSSSLINSTFRIINSTTNSTNISVTLPYQDTFKWNYLVSDNSSNAIFNATNFTVTYITFAPIINIIRPLNVTYTTKLIYLNLSTDISAECQYNIDHGQNITMSANSSSTGFNITKSFSADGTYTAYFYCNNSLGNSYDINSTSVSFGIDSTPPSVSIISPRNSTYHDDESLIFNITSSDSYSSLDSIWFFIENSSFIEIENTTTSGYGSVDLSEEGPFILHAYANDSLGNLNNSETVYFYVNDSDVVVIFTKYITSANTTNLYALNQTQLENISNFTIDSPGIGQILFTKEINLMMDADSDLHIDLDSYINISFNYIEINSSGLTSLNKTAILTLKNITYTNPQILRNGGLCGGDCNILNYTNGILLFNVSGFSSYSSRETPSSSTINNNAGSGGSFGGSTKPGNVTNVSNYINKSTACNNCSIYNNTQTNETNNTFDNKNIKFPLTKFNKLTVSLIILSLFLMFFLVYITLLAYLSKRKKIK